MVKILPRWFRRFPKLFAANLKLLMKFPDKFLPVLKFPKRIYWSLPHIGCWCNSYQGCRYCWSNQLKVKLNVPVVEELGVDIAELANLIVWWSWKFKERWCCMKFQRTLTMKLRWMLALTWGLENTRRKTPKPPCFIPQNRYIWVFLLTKRLLPKCRRLYLECCWFRTTDDSVKWGVQF